MVTQREIDVAQRALMDVLDQHTWETDATGWHCICGESATYGNPVNAHIAVAFLATIPVAPDPVTT